MVSDVSFPEGAPELCSAGFPVAVDSRASRVRRAVTFDLVRLLRQSILRDAEARSSGSAHLRTFEMTKGRTVS